MLDKIYIFLALVVGITVSIIMLIGDYTAKEWATTTFWCILIYLIIGLILRNYLKKKVFAKQEQEILIDKQIEKDEITEDVNEDEEIKKTNIEEAFLEEDDE